MVGDEHNARATGIALAIFIALCGGAAWIYKEFGPEIAHLWSNAGRSDDHRSPLLEKADKLFKSSLDHSFQGRNSKARRALDQALLIYEQEGGRLGQANVLLGLGDLEGGLGNFEDARQHYYQAAKLYEQVGIHDWKDIALGRARNLPDK